LSNSSECAEAELASTVIESSADGIQAFPVAKPLMPPPCVIIGRPAIVSRLNPNPYLDAAAAPTGVVISA